jgi:adenylylsulfate kinase
MTDSGIVFYFTGPPSSGKSRLSRNVARRLAEQGVPPVVLDGDELRACFASPPGYDAASRDDFYETLARLGALFARQGHVVLVAATAHLRRYRERARAEAPRFVEVLLETSLEECRRRDAKGLYEKVREGALSNVPGADLEYEAPLAPEVRANGGDDERACEAICETVRALRIRASAPA